MDITYLGHSTFRLKGKEATLVTDPYDPAKVGIKFPKISADIVTISHDHFDHNNSKLVSDVKKVIAGPGEYEVSGVSIIGYPTYHDDKKGEERGKNTMYVIEMDGVRLAHLGDLGHKLSEDEVEKIGAIDVLMLPVGGFFTVGPEEASFIAKSIEPSFTIPMHFKTKEHDSSFEKLSGVDEFIKEVSLPTEKTDKLSIKDTDLTGEQKVVVLDLK